jgi:hypothetical protein
VKTTVTEAETVLDIYVKKEVVVGGVQNELIQRV